MSATTAAGAFALNPQTRALRVLVPLSYSSEKLRVSNAKSGYVLGWREGIEDRLRRRECHVERVHKRGIATTTDPSLVQRCAAQRTSMTTMSVNASASICNP